MGYPLRSRTSILDFKHNATIVHIMEQWEQKRGHFVVFPSRPLVHFLYILSHFPNSSPRFAKNPFLFSAFT